MADYFTQTASSPFTDFYRTLKINQLTALGSILRRLMLLVRDEPTTQANIYTAIQTELHYSRTGCDVLRHRRK